MPVAGVEYGKKKVRSYSRMFESEMTTAWPTTVGALVQVLADASANGVRVTLHSAGHSLHNQALNDDPQDLCVALERMPLAPSFAVDRTTQAITVEGWRSWGSIVEGCLAQGFVPFVAVSSSRATVAGSLAADGLSRFSPVAGKQSHTIRALQIVLADGRQATVVHPRLWSMLAAEAELEAVPGGARSPLSEADNAELFAGIVSGYGLIACVTFVTMFVACLDGQPNAAERYSIATFFDAMGAGRDPRDPEGPRYSGFERVLRTMDHNMEKLRASRLAPAPVAPPNTPYAHGFPLDLPLTLDETYRSPFSVLFINPVVPDNEHGAASVSWFTTRRDYPEYDGFVPDTTARALKPALWLLPGAPYLVEAGLWTTMLLADERTFANSVSDYTFFMMGHCRAMEELDRDGTPSGAIQQSFAIRSFVGLDDTPTEIEPTREFLRAARDLFQRGALNPDAADGGAERLDPVPTTLVDVLHIPEGEGYLSATFPIAPGPAGRTDGWVVTFGFEGVRSTAHRRAVIAALEQVSRMAHEQFGARVHLAKDVYVEPDVLAAMYGPALVRFGDAKLRWDPKGTLCSDFWDDRLRPALEIARGGLSPT